MTTEHDGNDQAPVVTSTPTAAAPSDQTRPRGWFNRTIIGMGLTSLLADMNYEMSSAILPGFIAALGLPAYVLGIIEGLADAAASFTKLGAGWVSDGLGQRKPLVVAGYSLTGISQAVFALAHGWPLIGIGRVAGWLGRGLRKPPRDAMLAESISAADRGKAFGFHRAGDSIGAILGPLLGVGVIALVGPAFGDGLTDGFRLAFVVTLIPGIGAALVFAIMIREARGRPRKRRRFLESIRVFPRPFRRYLVGVGVFGLGDFAHTLLLLIAAQLLAPEHGVVAAAQIAALLYALRNAANALAAFPVGAASDRLGRRGLLVGGYVLGALVMVGFALMAAAGGDSILLLAILFVLAGTYVAFEDALEGAMTADLVPDLTIRGTAFGVLGTANGVGDLVSSIVVGALWIISPVWGFAYAAVVMLAGAGVLGTSGRLFEPAPTDS